MRRLRLGFRFESVVLWGVQGKQGSPTHDTVRGEVRMEGWQSTVPVLHGHLTDDIHPLEGSGGLGPEF